MLGQVVSGNCVLLFNHYPRRLVFFKAPLKYFGGGKQHLSGRLAEKGGVHKICLHVYLVPNNLHNLHLLSIPKSDFSFI